MVEDIYLKKPIMKKVTNITIEATSWKEFFLEDIVTIGNGKRLTKADMQCGNIPFIGASEMNNGITGYTSSVNESIDNNVLGVNYNGSVGFSFYHPYNAIFSDDVKRVKWIDRQHNNKYTLLFLSSMIRQQKIKYAYGYKFNTKRMQRQKIMLPVTNDDFINWQFMEEYMKAKEQAILEHTIKTLCKHLIYNELTGGAIYSTQIGKHLILQRYLPKSNVVNDLKKQTIKKGISRMSLQLHLIMGSMALLEIKAA